MANAQNFRSGQMDLRKFDVLSTDLIETGDMMWFDDTNNRARPANTFDHDTDLATTQGLFAAVFAGIAYGASSITDDDDITIDVSGVSIYEFTVASVTPQVGDPFGPDEDTDPDDTLLNQVLESAIATSSIARCTQFAAAAVTKLEMQFASAFNVASNNVNNQVG